ncbi:MAG: hypothetical protein ABI969_03540 [bacterium]
MTQEVLENIGYRKLGHGATYVTAVVAVLQATDHDSVDRCTGNDAELTGAGYCLGELPAGDADAHATLNDPRVVL